MRLAVSGAVPGPRFGSRVGGLRAERAGIHSHSTGRDTRELHTSSYYGPSDSNGLWVPDLAALGLNPEVDCARWADIREGSFGEAMGSQ